MVRPLAEVVQREASGHPRQASPKIALRLVVTVRVTPAGQVRVPAAVSGAKSSRVNPPGTAGRVGQGLTIGVQDRWGREYGSGSTLASAGTNAPYWQHTVATNGGPCNDSAASCYTIPATGSKRYQLPSKFIGYINALDPGEWFTLQAYVLVTGKSPAYTSSLIRWDCSAANVRLHWTNDNERYCYKDWQAIVRAIDAKAGVVVTDPLTVGVAFGRPATYP